MILTVTKFNLADYTRSMTELIVDDLTATKRMYGFSLAGFNVESYRSRIHNTVFMLAGIEQKDRTEALKDWYFMQTERVFDIDISDEEKLFELAESILLSLNSWKAPDSHNLFAPNL